jgi:ssDNA-binding Zn-finger/Zn-ribbon topoisomerase 1
MKVRELAEIRNAIRSGTKAQCEECGRVFDLMNEEEASEFYNGHDCEE